MSPSLIWMMLTGLDVLMALLCFWVLHHSNHWPQNLIFVALGLLSLLYARWHAQGLSRHLPLLAWCEHICIWCLIVLHFGSVRREKTSHQKLPIKNPLKKENKK